jgi:hypothetical protein
MWAYLDDKQQTALISDILHERIKPLIPWIEVGRTKIDLLVETPETLAFDDLARRPIEFLNKHSSIFEHFYSEGLEGLSGNSSETIQPIFAKIKALVAHACAGLSRDFLLRQINFREDWPIREELDLYLFLAKVEERKKELNRDAWASWITDERLRQKPFLAIPLIYIYRDQHIDSVFEILARLDHIALGMSEMSSGLLDPVAKEYLLVYLRHALFLLLKQEEDHDSFSCFYYQKKALKSSWLIDLVDLTLQQPSLHKINQRLQLFEEQLVINLTNFGKPQSGRFQSDRERLNLYVSNLN